MHDFDDVPIRGFDRGTNPIEAGGGNHRPLHYDQTHANGAGELRMRVFFSWPMIAIN